MFKLRKKQLFFLIISILAIIGIVFVVSHSLSQEAYAVDVFTKTGSHTWTVPSGVTRVDVLVVAGGGGGGNRSTSDSGAHASSGGGGGGGIVYKKVSVTPGEIVNITVGDGGLAYTTSKSGDNGENSSFKDVTAYGGGGGSGDRDCDGKNGGSGGGGTFYTGTCGNGLGGESLDNQGNHGGGLNYPESHGGTGNNLSGGGGQGGTSTKNGGNGGNGGYYGNIFGDQYGDNGWFGGGGGGGTAYDRLVASGGLGGGGNGGVGSEIGANNSISSGEGINGSGGGGGGSGNGRYMQRASKGGSGIVLIKYRVKLGATQSTSLNKGLVGHWSMDADDYVEGTENLLYDNKTINWSISNLTTSISRTTIVENSRYKINSGSSSGTFRLNIPAAKLVSGETYTLSYKYKINTGTQFNMNDWCDTSLFNKIDIGNGVTDSYSSASGVRTTYDSTYHFMDFYITANTEIEIWDVQLEKKDHATPFTTGIRTGRLTDSSFKGNHGVTAINQSPTFTEDRFGKEGGAMKFDGSGTVDGIVLGNNVEILESITDTRNYPNGCAYSFWLNVDADAVNRMSLFRGASTIRHIELYSSGKNFRTEASLQNGYSFGSTAFPKNIRGEWAHFVIVFANNEPNKPVRWYQNGELFSTGYMANGTYPDTEYFSFSSIGRSTGSVDYNYAKSFDGAIDDFRIYDHALSETEIKSLYDTYNSKTTTGSLQQGLILDMPLKLQYTKSETAGSEIMTDRTPYSNDGQNYGAVITNEGASFISNDWIGTPYGQGVNPSIIPHSFSVWVKSNSPASNYMFLSTGQSPVSNNRLYLGTYGGNWDMGIHNSGWGGGATDVTTDWTHISVVMDGTYAKMFINGQPDLQRAYGSYTFNKNIDIGRHADGSYYFNGSISNLLIYNRALSDKEIKTLYDRGRGDTGIVFRPYGSSQDSPGISCKDILDNNSSALNLDGLYWINPDGSGAFQAYCDMTTDGGGWTLVLLSNKSKQYCPNVNWESVINNVNYNGSLSSNIETFDLFMGLKYWNSLGTKLRFDMGNNSKSLTHRTYQDFSIKTADNYKISMSNQVISIGGSSSGLYSSHNNNAMTTYDKDNDVHSGNCSTFYNNAPWWYNSCWSGNFWGGCGNGYQDGPFWVSSGSEYFNYGSIWAR